MKRLKSLPDHKLSTPLSSFYNSYNTDSSKLNQRSVSHGRDLVSLLKCFLSLSELLNVKTDTQRFYNNVYCLANRCLQQRKA